MFSTLASSIESSSSAITAHSRLRDIKAKITEAVNAIFNLEYDLIGLIFTPELSIPPDENTGQGENSEKKKPVYINPVQIIDSLSDFRALKKDLSHLEYFWSEILEESKNNYSSKEKDVVFINDIESL